MRKSFLAAALLLVTGLSGCVVTEPSTIRDVHTGVQAGVSREYVAAQNFGEIVRAQAMIGTALGQPGYLLKIRRNGSFSRNAFYRSAYSYGRELPYSYGGSKVIACAAIGCDVMEWGQVTITAGMFQQGLSNGMQLKLVGTHASTVIHVPPEAFRQAKAAMPR